MVDKKHNTISEANEKFITHQRKLNDKAKKQRRVINKRQRQARRGNR